MQLEGIEWLDSNRFKCYCPFHDDIANRNTKHAVVYVNTGYLVCFHCGVQKLDKAVLLNHQTSSYEFGEKEIRKPLLHPGAGTMRHTAISPRMHAVYGGHLWDGFNIYNPQVSLQAPTGILLRKNTNKKAYVWGTNGLILNTDQYYSFPDDPIHVVEGVYDIRTPRYISVNGMINSSVLKYFNMQSIILIPDGDVWDGSEKTDTIKKTIEVALKSNKVNLVEVWVLPDGIDPDMMENNITRIQRKQLPAFLKGLKSNDRGSI